MSTLHFKHKDGSGVIHELSLPETTTKGDVIVHNGTENIRVAVGTNGQVLTADSAEASGVKWAAAGGGLSSPLTTKGDVWVFSTVDARLPVGTNGKILSADSAEATGLKWIDPPAAVSDGDKGDITVSGSGATWTIDAGAVTDAKIANRNACSVMGRSANTAGAVADITATDGQVLRRSGTTLGFGAVSLSTAASITGNLPLGNGGTGAALTDPNADRILFWDDSAGAVTWLTAGTGLAITATTIDVTSGIADGDKGDITVSASGATWTIDNDAVSDAKLRNSAALSVIGRSANSVGDPADIAASEGGSFLGLQGDGNVIGFRNFSTLDSAAIVDADSVPFYDSSATANRRISAQGLKAYIAGAAMVLLDSGSASGVASMDFSFSAAWTNSDFAAYMIVFSHVAPATDNVDLWVRTSTDGGTTYDAGAGNYRWTHLRQSETANAQAGSASDTKIVLEVNMGNAANENISGWIKIYRPVMAGFGTITFQVAGTDTAGSCRHSAGSGKRVTAADVDALRIMFSSGNIASGEFRLYGLPNAL
jgi:hypothetical protein